MIRNRDGRIIGTVKIIAADHQILPGIQSRKPGKNLVPFLKSGVPSAVNAKGDQPAFLKQRESLLQSLDAGFGLCGQGMISSGKIAQIKYNTADRSWRSIAAHIDMGIKDQLIIFGSACTLQALSGISKSHFLNVKGQYLSVFFTECT